MAQQVQAAADQLVRSYLLSKGYAKAAAALEAEASNLPLEASSLAAGASPKPPSLVQSILSTTLEDMYVLGLKDGDGLQYANEFKMYVEWMTSSLDIVKPGLQALSFVLLLHCYIGLVRYGCEAEARNLLSLHRDMLVDCFLEELHYLSLLQHKEQLSQMEFLQQNPVVRSAIQERCSVTLTTLAFRLLAAFLDLRNLVLLASIINEKVNIVTVSGHSQPLETDITAFVQLPGYAPPPRSSNTTKLVLGVPGNGRALAQAQALSPLFQSIQPVDRNDVVTKTWLDKLVRPKLLLKPQLKKARSSLNEESKRVLSLHATVEAIRQAEKQPPEATGDPLEPSVLFATIGNAQDNLLCMHMNSSVTQAVTGYADSTVRVWRLDHGQNPYNPAFGQSLPSTAYTWTMNEVLPAAKQAMTEEYVENAKASLLQASEEVIRQYAQTKYPCLELKGHGLPVYSVHQDSSERWILSSSADESIRLWDTAVLQCVAKYDCLSVPWEVKFHPLDFYFASANQDRSVTVYTTDCTSPLRILSGHTSDVNTVCWHGNGGLLASGGDDRTVRLWDIRRAECVRVLRGCSSAVSSLSVSSLGNLLAAGTESGNIYLYELMTSRLLAVLHGHTGPVYSLGFGGDGLTVISGSKDCSVRVWNTTPAFHADTTPSSLLALGEVPASAKLVLKPKTSFFTKATPVYSVGFTPHNLAYAGGPCQAASREGNAMWSSQMAAEVKSEHDMANLLRLSSAVPSNP